MKTKQITATAMLAGLMTALPILTMADPALAQARRGSSGGGGLRGRSGDSNRPAFSEQRRDSSPSRPQERRDWGQVSAPRPVPGMDRGGFGFTQDRSSGPARLSGGSERPSFGSSAPVASRPSPGFSLPRTNLGTSPRQSGVRPRRDDLPPRPNPTRDGIRNPLPSRLSDKRDRWDRDRWDRDRGWDRPGDGIIFSNGPVRIINSGGGVTIVNGYRYNYIPGQTYYSPFSVYNCAPYIASGFVLTSPYAYQYGRESASFSPYADDDRYYAADAYRGRSLRAALNDLARFWEENDTRSLRRRVPSDYAVAIFQDERYVYSVRQADFLALSGDALDRVQTLSFRFTNVRERTDGLVNAYALHTYRVRGEGGTRAATVRYTLVYVDGDWYISAVSLAPEVAR